MEKLFVTKNKIKVYSYDMPHLHSFHLTLNVRAGKIHDQIPGITHFLEHVMCQGVRNVFENDTAQDIDRYGLDFNGTTYNNCLQFEISGNMKCFKEACHIFTKLLSEDILTIKAFKEEKLRISREIEENYNPSSLKSLADDVVWDGTPLSRHQSSQIFEKINLNQLKNERKKIFNYNNIFFYLTGAVSQEDMHYFYYLIEQYSINEGYEKNNFITQPQNFLNRNVQIFAMPNAYNGVSFNFDFDAGKYSFHEIRFLCRLLFVGGSSIMYQTLSQKNGLIYDYNHDEYRFKNIGVISYDYEVNSDAILESIKIVAKIIKDIKHNIPDMHFNRVKAYYLINTHYAMDCVSTMNFCMTQDVHMLSQNYNDFNDFVNPYNQITKERIIEVAKELLTPRSLSIIIKWEKKPDIKKIKEILNGI